MKRIKPGAESLKPAARPELEGEPLASGDEFQALIQSMPQIAWLASADRHGEVFNQSWKEYTGLDHVQSFGSGWQSIVHPEDLPTFLERWAEGINQSASFQVQLRLKGITDGLYRWHATQAIPLRPANTRFIKWLVTCLDIHKDKLTAEEAHRIQENSHLVLQAVKHCAIFLLDPSGHILSWNQGAENLTGYRADEIVGRNFAIFYPPELRHEGKPKQALNDASAHRQFEEEGWRLRKAGLRFWADVALTALLEEPGSLRGFAVVMRDRTEHRPGIASFRAVLEAVPDAIVVSDEQGQILLVNSQTERLFGYAREQLVRQPTEMLILEQFREHHARHRKEYLQRPHTRLMDRGLEVVGQRADGSEFPVEICLSLLQEEAGMFICHAIRDLTERQRYENTLKWTAAELTRTNAELEQLAYAASHDLQEPLRTVVGATQILGRDYSSKLDPEAREWLVFATEGAKRMQELLNALLEYARLGTRRRPFELVDCEKIYQAAVANLKLSIEESEAEVTHGPLPMVLGDGVQLIQLFQNLLSNALKFRRPDRPRVHVSAQPEQNHWRVCVRDNGIGIDPKHFNRIFSLFQRLHTREQFPGAGIGLAICKKIVEQHGGRIGVESKPGEGSNFFFSIPMVETQALPASPFTGTSGALA